MLLWIHIIGVLILILSAGWALWASHHNQIGMMIARLCYIVLMVTGGILFFKAFHRSPILDILKVILAFGLIGSLEMTFAQKVHQKLRRPVIMGVLGGGILVIILGIIVAGGRPFI
jgi:hypothetical protein